MESKDNSFLINEEWDRYLDEEIKKLHLSGILELIRAEREIGNVIYPEDDEIFNAFKLVSPDEVKVVIIGQDPYHGLGQAHGLCFSVRNGVKIPPSLRNILKEVEAETGKRRTSSDLSDWARQGVLLLNSVLSVREGAPNSHAGLGWEHFTSNVVRKLSQDKERAFLLWGKNAENKKHFIEKGLILTAPHPSPLSARRGWFGCGHFLKVNEWLKEKGNSPINWAP